MSVAMGKKATPAAPGKTKKGSAGEKVAKTSIRKTRSNASNVKKKTVGKKTAKKEKAASSKTAVATRRKKNRAPKQAHTTSGHKTPEETKSLSWMSAQAASALKAVEAIQAEKGRAILAKTRKQAAEKHINDDRLIEIAAAMPVDNEGLIEFSTELPHEEHTPQADTAFSATEAIMDESSGNTDTSSDKAEEPESTLELADERIETSTSPAEQPEPTQPPPPPSQQLAKSTVALRPALAAGIIFAALLLGFYFWPGGNDTNGIDNSATVAAQESTAIEAPATMAEPDPVVPWVPIVDDVATAPVTEPDQEPTKSHNEQTSSGKTRDLLPSSRPQTAAITPAPEPKPAPVESQPAAAQPAQPPAPWTAPARRNYGVPVYGSYPQQQQPAYPQYYYR
jgi:hypothetical protein